MLALKAFIAGALILATSAYARGGDSTVTVTVTNTSNASKTFSYTYGEGSESTTYTIAAGGSQTIEIETDCEFTITEEDGLMYQDSTNSINPSSGDCSDVDGCTYDVSFNECNP